MHHQVEAVAVAAMGADVGAVAVFIVEAVTVAATTDGAGLVLVGERFRWDAEGGQDVPLLVAGGVAQVIGAHDGLLGGRAAPVGLAGGAHRRPAGCKRRP